jgi:hypothetical protein
MFRCHGRKASFWPAWAPLVMVRLSSHAMMRSGRVPPLAGLIEGWVGCLAKALAGLAPGPRLPMVRHQAENQETNHFSLPPLRSHPQP